MNFDQAVEHLPKEVQQIIKDVAGEAGTYDADFAVFEAAGWEIYRLRRVLAHYAKTENYKSPSTGFAHQYDPEPSWIQKDRGFLARNALDTDKL